LPSNVQDSKGDSKIFLEINLDVLLKNMEKEFGAQAGGMFGSNADEYAEFMDSGMEKEMGMLFTMFLKERGLPKTTFMSDKLCTDFENWLDKGLMAQPDLPDDAFADQIPGYVKGGPKKPAQKGQPNRGRKL
jgi:hypothetical protein